MFFFGDAAYRKRNRFMNIGKLALDLACLKGHAFSDYRLPFRQAAILLTLLGLSGGLDPALGIPMPWSFVVGLFLWWLWAAGLFPFMRWWLKRGDRWNGEGPLFTLLVAASGVSMLWGVLAYFLGHIHVPSIILLLSLWPYSLWVMAKALKQAIGVKMSYTIVGQLSYHCTR